MRSNVQKDAVGFLYVLLRYGNLYGCDILDEIVMPCDELQIGERCCSWLNRGSGEKARYVRAVRDANHPSLFSLQCAMVLYAETMSYETIDKFVYGLSEPG